MLKSYAGENKLQWVGKAWEIRSAIRRLKQEQGGNARLVEVTNRLSRKTQAR